MTWGRRNCGILLYEKKNPFSTIKRDIKYFHIDLHTMCTYMYFMNVCGA